MIDGVVHVQRCWNHNYLVATIADDLARGCNSVSLCQRHLEIVSPAQGKVDDCHECVNVSNVSVLLTVDLWRHQCLACTVSPGVIPKCQIRRIYGLIRSLARLQSHYLGAQQSGHVDGELVRHNVAPPRVRLIPHIRISVSRHHGKQSEPACLRFVECKRIKRLKILPS